MKTCICILVSFAFLVCGVFFFNSLNPGVTTMSTENQNISTEKNFSNSDVNITWSNSSEVTNERLVTIILSHNIIGFKIESNMENTTIEKENDKKYVVHLTIPEGSHGIAALLVSGNGIDKVETTQEY
jgi:hypothetical protein